jgi:hypothetical protein
MVLELGASTKLPAFTTTYATTTSKTSTLSPA